MNIFISICGEDENFKKLYTYPKSFVQIHGQPMINYVLNNLNIKTNIYFLYPSAIKDNRKFLKLKQQYTSQQFQINFIEVDIPTKGQVQTFRYIFNNKLSNITGKCIVIDCDTVFYIDLNKIPDTNVLHYFNDYDIKPIYSYISLGNNNKITDIQEKIKISTKANAGLYSFTSAEFLIKYLNRTNSTLFSGMIKDMIDNNEEIYGIYLKNNDFDSLGTPNLVKMFVPKISNKKTFCFQLENGLFINDIPITKTVSMIHRLKKLGNIIVIKTKLNNDNPKYAYDLLNKYEIPYDIVSYENMNIDFNIGDNYFEIEHLEKELGYYQTGIKERSFNQIETSTMEIVTKKSKNKSIIGEVYWYENIPHNLKHLFPIFITGNIIKDEYSYSIEKIKGISASYLLIQNTLDIELFKTILSSLREIHNTTDTCVTVEEENQSKDFNIYANYSNKIKKRYLENKEIYQNLDDNIELVYIELLDFFEDYEKNNCGKQTIIHGDPVFTNILIDSKSNIKFIDMRGLLGDFETWDNVTIQGDMHYDYGKIYQSLCGYDAILHNVEKNNELKNWFEKYIIETYSLDILNNIKMITKSLLFTLIPLHLENRKEFYNLMNEIN